MLLKGSYDKTLREIFSDVPVNLIKFLTNQEIKRPLNPSFPSIKERIADFLVELENGDIFHLEIQSVNDKTMPRRMLFYALLIEEKYKKFPIQVVLYVGNEKLRMQNFYKRKNLDYKYELFNIKNLDCNYLIKSQSIEDNLIAILCKIDDEVNLLNRITSRLLSLPDKKRVDYLKKLFILARLRPKVYNKLEEFYKEQKMPIVLDPKIDPLYKKGWNEAWSEAEKKTKIKDALLIIEKFNIPIEKVAKELGLKEDEIKKALNENK
ncbi:MAG: hypothetical protein ABGX26_05905 [Nautiliaceae bacterium]